MDKYLVFFSMLQFTVTFQTKFELNLNAIIPGVGGE